MALLGILLIGIWLVALGHRFLEHRRIQESHDLLLLDITDTTVELLHQRHRDIEQLSLSWRVDHPAVGGLAESPITQPPAAGPASLVDLLIGRLTGLLALSWIDTEGRVLWSAPNPQSHSSTKRGALENPRTAPSFVFARKSLSPQTAPAIQLPQGDWGFVTYFPVVADGRAQGLLEAVFRFRDVLSRSLPTPLPPELDLELVYDDVVLCRLPGIEEIATDGSRAADRPPNVGPNVGPNVDTPYVGSVQTPTDDPTVTRISTFQIHGHRYELRLTAAPVSGPMDLGAWLLLLGAHLLAVLLVWVDHRLDIRRCERRARTHLMEGVFSNLPVTAFSVGPDGEVEQSFGKAAVGLGLSSRGGETLDGFPALVRPLQRALAGESVHLEADLQTDTGDTRTYELFLLHDELRGGGALGFAIDVSARKWVEKALQRNEERYRRFFREAPFAYFAVDLDGRIEIANDLAAQLTGYSLDNLKGLLCTQLFAHSEDQLRLESAHREDELRNHEVELLRADGSTFWGSLSVQPLRDGTQLVGRGLIVLDITQRKQLQEQVRQSQKMEAVGRLAGGIAHDFNNLLTAIMGYARMALERVAEDGRLRHDLEEIQKACRRATSLVSQLLAFSRRQIVEPKVFDLNGLLRDMDPMLRRLTREEVDLASHLTRGSGRIRMDPGQMEQVIVNLVVNAQEAISGDGWITIETDNLPVEVGAGGDGAADGAADNSSSTTHHTEWVRLRVSDTGSGMSPDVQEHIFEPFFTTKEDLSGTGLGLATVYGIVVEQSAGQILVNSEVGKGTTISILLPRVYDAIDVDDEPLPIAQPSAGHERILLVEDEEMVRELAAEMLSSLGYEVIQAKNGLDALDRVEGREHEIDLLLTDVVMPKMGGEKLYLELRRRNPEIRVLYSSGYTESAVIHHGVKEGEVPFVHKPYTFDALAQAVQIVLKS